MHVGVIAKAMHVWIGYALGNKVKNCKPVFFVWENCHYWP